MRCCCWMSQYLGVTVIFDGCTIVPPIALPVPAAEHQQSHYHQLRQLHWRHRCSTCHRLELVFTPSVRKSARYPDWKFRRGSSAATRPRSRCVAHDLQHANWHIWGRVCLQRVTKFLTFYFDHHVSTHCVDYETCSVNTPHSPSYWSNNVLKHGFICQ